MVTFLKKGIVKIENNGKIKYKDIKSKNQISIQPIKINPIILNRINDINLFPSFLEI